ncbi:MAG: hypothetical protein NTX75_12775 [Proteobacteria bacterium]|nr:hypothetical protein [Pseudomonadota bacterium]
MGKTKILIVEDNSIIALQSKVISATFESDVTGIASSGILALSIIKKDRQTVPSSMASSRRILWRQSD